MNREKVSKELEEAREFIRTSSGGSASKKCRLMDACNNAISLLKEQEAKTGHWIGPECSSCHAILEKKANYEWCPYCGAHMIEEVKENENE